MNTCASIENWRIFISAVPMGHKHHLFSLNGLHAVTCSGAEHIHSLLSCWLHVNLCVSAQLWTATHHLFSCYLQNPHRGQELLLPGPGTLSSAQPSPSTPPFFFKYITKLLFCGIQGKKIEKSFCGLPLGCRSTVLSSMSAAIHLFSAWGPVFMELHFLSVIVYTVPNLTCICLFSRMGYKWRSVLHKSEEPEMPECVYDHFH